VTLVTRLLDAARRDDPHAAELLPLAYAVVRKRAAVPCVLTGL